MSDHDSEVSPHIAQPAPRILLTRVIVAFAIALLAVVGVARAQVPDAAPPTARPFEIELNVINLPTTHQVKRHGSYFRLTHRFARDLRRGDFGSLAEDLFSLDSGAIIGLEYRYGITSDLHVGVHRSLLRKTIQLFGRYDRWQQGADMPVSISFIGAVEGQNNLRDDHQPTIGATISRAVAGRLALHVTPAFVGGTRAADLGSGGSTDELADHTVFVGFGGRLRLRPSVFVTGEITPRLAGYDPGNGTWGFAVEKKTRGHTLQMNFTNSFGTTFGQLARGGSEHDVYLGFNVTRVF